MDIRKIKKLIELLEESGIAEIEIKEGEEAVRISRMPTGNALVHALPQFALPQIAASRPALRMRRAISPRLAMRTFSSMAVRAYSMTNSGWPYSTGSPLRAMIEVIRPARSASI